MNEANKLKTNLAVALSQKFDYIHYDLTSPENAKNNNIYLDSPEELFIKSKIPAFGITTKLTKPSGDGNKRTYHLTDNVGVESKVVTKETLWISILHENSYELRLLEIDLVNYLSSLMYIDITTVATDGYKEGAELVLGKITHKQGGQYPFRTDIELICTYRIFSECEYYEVETIRVDLDIVDVIEQDEEESTIPESTVTITPNTDGSERITIQKV